MLNCWDVGESNKEFFILQKRQNIFVGRYFYKCYYGNNFNDYIEIGEFIEILFGNVIKILLI